MKEPIAKNLKYLAARLGAHTQPEIQALTGVPQTTISGIINQGKMPRLSTLQKLAEGLGVELWQLLAPHEMSVESLDENFKALLNLYCRASSEAQRNILIVAEAQYLLSQASS